MPATVGQFAPAGPTMLPCMSIVMLMLHMDMLMTVRSAALLRDAKRGAGDISCATACAQRLWNAFIPRWTARLGTPVNGLAIHAAMAAMRHRERGARVLDSSTSHMVRIAHR